MIAVGGDKLSRGLTLEGLTVSYYLRASKMYDTLMQMGRWFGYRPGYLDVCRLYTTEELASWYRDIAVANEELLREFDYMVALGRHPRITACGSVPSRRLMITAAAKMRNGAYVDVTFSQTISESIYFDTDSATLKNNLEAAEQLVVTVRNHRRGPSPHRRRLARCPAACRSGFPRPLPHPRQRNQGPPPALAEYIRTMTAADPPELTSWTVALISVEARQGLPPRRPNAGLVTRAVWDPRTGRHWTRIPKGASSPAGTATYQAAGQSGGRVSSTSAPPSRRGRSE